MLFKNLPSLLDYKILIAKNSDFFFFWLIKNHKVSKIYTSKHIKQNGKH